ncbi:MAG: FAD-linked oxidase C-terminal domain-containing protein [Thermodesulfobacteriota bacterium]
MDSHIIQALKDIVGTDRLETAAEELQCYSYDGTGQEFVPAAVAFPASTEQISKIMELATAEQFPVVPRGAGSGMTGGSLPVAGGLVLALGRMDRILEIDEENQLAIVEPGVITGKLRETLAPLGLFYPPDPASLKFCTLGGNVAECAGGPSAVKYGVTRDYVLGLEVVLADGRILETGVRTRKGVVGYDLTRLFTGSEGTLGVITKIILRLTSRPTASKTFLLLFAEMVQAATLVADMLKEHAPSTLEYLDHTALSLVADKLPFDLPAKTKAMLLVELDGDAQSVKLQNSRLNDFLAGRPDILLQQQAETPEEVDNLWMARRSVSPAAFNLRPDKISEDVVVPRSKIPDLVACAAELGSRYQLPIFTFGHAGDGNIHVNIMVDKANQAEVDRAQQAKEALFRHVLDLQGSLSGEHGIGLTKAPFLDLELSETSLDIQQQLKNLFDPLHILNPGKIF